MVVNKQRPKKIVVAVSGGFDPVHTGHIQLFEEAKKLGDELIVILNNDNWLKKKKGFFFINVKERKQIIEAIKWIDKIVITKHGPNSQDMSVKKELAKIKPDIYANGGDRTKDNIPEIGLCKRLGIKMVFNVGGGKIQSSSWLLKKFLSHIKEI